MYRMRFMFWRRKRAREDAITLCALWTLIISTRALFRTSCVMQLNLPIPIYLPTAVNYVIYTQLGELADRGINKSSVRWETFNKKSLPSFHFLYFNPRLRRLLIHIVYHRFTVNLISKHLQYGHHPLGIPEHGWLFPPRDTTSLVLTLMFLCLTFPITVLMNTRSLTDSFSHVRYPGHFLTLNPSQP